MRQVTRLAPVNIIAFRLPNVDAATNSGIHHAITPSILSANVYAQMNMQNTDSTEQTTSNKPNMFASHATRVDNTIQYNEGI